MRNYYDSLQLSPSADPVVVDAAYRALLEKYHPDNVSTGDADKFREVCEAYDILSDPGRRAALDELIGDRSAAAPPRFKDDSRAKMYRRQKEVRNSILHVLYENRVTNPYRPAMPLRTIAQLVQLDAEELEVARWYLLEKNYIAATSAADLWITAAGVDYIEAETLTPLASRVTGENPAE